MNDKYFLTIILSLVGFVLGYAAAKLTHKSNAKPVRKDTQVTLVHQIPPRLGGYSLKYYHASGLYEDDLPCNSHVRNYLEAKRYYALLATNSNNPSIRLVARQFHKAIILFDAQSSPSLLRPELK